MLIRGHLIRFRTASAPILKGLEHTTPNVTSSPFRVPSSGSTLSRRANHKRQGPTAHACCCNRSGRPWWTQPWSIRGRNPSGVVVKHRRYTNHVECTMNGTLLAFPACFLAAANGVDDKLPTELGDGRSCRHGWRRARLRVRAGWVGGGRRRHRLAPRTPPSPPAPPRTVPRHMTRRSTVPTRRRRKASAAWDAAGRSVMAGAVTPAAAAAAAAIGTFGIGGRCYRPGRRHERCPCDTMHPTEARLITVMAFWIPLFLAR